jgi:hypothetical protein
MATSMFLARPFPFFISPFTADITPTSALLSAVNDEHDIGLASGIPSEDCVTDALTKDH